MVVSNQIVETINALCDKFGIVIDWSQKNVLPYIQNLMTEYINYEILTSSIWVVVSIVAIIVSVLIWKKQPKLSDCDDDFIEDTVFFKKLVLFFIMCICILMFFLQFHDVLRCATIPELQVFNYLKGLQ